MVPEETRILPLGCIESAGQRMSRLEKALQVLASNGSAHIVVSLTQGHEEAHFAEVKPRLSGIRHETQPSRDTVSEIIFVRDNLAHTVIVTSWYHVPRVKALCHIHMTSEQRKYIRIVGAWGGMTFSECARMLLRKEPISWYKLCVDVVGRHHKKGELPANGVKKALDLLFGKQKCLAKGQRVLSNAHHWKGAPQHQQLIPEEAR